MAGSMCGTAHDPSHRLRSRGTALLEFDPYTPLTITWPGYGRSPDTPRYASAVQGRNHVEFKFHPGTGELVEIVLTAAGDATIALGPVPPIDSVPPLDAMSIRDEGNRAASQVPVVAVGPPASPGELAQVTVFDDAVEVRYRPGSAARAVSSGPVCFEFTADGDLIRWVLALSARDRRTFLDAL